MKKPTITYIIFNTKNNGGNKVIFEHVNRLQKRGYDINVITFFGKQPEWFPLRIKVRHLFRFLSTPSPDILVATFWPTAWLGNFITSKRRLHLILGWDEDMHKNLLLKMLARKSLQLGFEKIVINKFLAKRMKRYTSKNIFPLDACGINLSIFKPKGEGASPKKSKVKILSVISRYKWYKGTDLLIEIIKQLKQYHPNYQFTLVSLENKPYSSIIDRFFSNISTKKLVELYQESDLFLVTSRREGFFIPGLEAMACGCPVITTRNEGILEYAANNKNAIIVKDIDHISKNNIIENLLTNKKLLTKIVDNGYLTVAKYKWDTIIDQLEQIYNLRHKPQV